LPFSVCSVFCIFYIYRYWKGSINKDINIFIYVNIYLYVYVYIFMLPFQTEKGSPGDFP
jgi:hypothetical protein